MTPMGTPGGARAPPRSALRPATASQGAHAGSSKTPKTIEEFIECQEVSYYDYELGAPCYELKGYVIVLVETAERGIRLYGSPAGMDGLGVADEILDVNEIALPATASRMDFLKHLYESIQSCVVKLRVKKSSTARIAQDLGPFLQDAFVIAVEDEARKRLAKLAALNKVTPVDITELAKRLNSKDSVASALPGGATDPANFPLYVTSLGGTATSSTATSAIAASGGQIGQQPLPSAQLPNGHGPIRQPIPEEPPLLPTTGAITTTCTSVLPPLAVSHQRFSPQPGGSEVLLGEQLRTTAVIENQQLLNTPSQDRPRRRSGGSIVVLGGPGSGDTEKPRLPDGDYPQGQQGTDMLSAVMSLAHDNGPHREMAVDVPDSFVARNKTPPRYPPPKPPQQMNGTIPHPVSVSAPPPSSGTATAQTAVPAAVALPVPPPREHLRIERDGRLVNRAPAPQVPARTAQPQVTPPPPPQGAVTEQQMESIRKYQDQLRKRREEEARIAQQSELLRASLRGSAKLRALQQQPPLRGALNQAYEDDDGAEEEEGVEADQDELLDRQLDQSSLAEDAALGNGPAITTYGELSASLARVAQSLRRHGCAALAARCAAAQGVLLGAQLARALATRQAAVEHRGRGKPACKDAQGLARECTDALRALTTPAATGKQAGVQANAAVLAQASELCDLLGSYEMEGVLQAYDRIAAAVSLTPSGAKHSPQSAVRSSNHQNAAANRVQNHAAAAVTAGVGAPALLAEDDGIRIIQIEKTNEPLGATIRNEGEAVIIGRVVRGGAAEKTGLLHEGDELLEVNGVPLRGKSVNDVCAALAAMSGTLTLLVAPRSSLSGALAGGVATLAGASSVLHVRAHFDYDPEDDRYIPCRELGIGFQKGDVLHVISRDDPNWWQAFREGEEDQTLAGLIPSQAFQHQRELMRKQSMADAAALASGGTDGSGGTLGRRGGGGTRRVAGTLLCSRGKAPKRRKRAGTADGLVGGGSTGGMVKGGSEAGYPLYAANGADEPDEILTYEEVALYYPRANHKRPVVLIGPPNIGRHELRQRLMADAERFAAAVPHTSRPRGDGEVAGQDYHFISRAQFEADILARRFVEHGEYEKAYYGTSLDAIRSVVASGKICVLNLHPQSLRLLRSSDLKPYTVLVAPPSLEKLRQKRLRTGEPYKEDELKDIIATAREMEARWGHLFDMIIINNDTERAYQQLLSEINSLEREPQWVPAAWLH